MLTSSVGSITSASVYARIIWANLAKISVTLVGN
jgi:hypothetical protein